MKETKKKESIFAKRGFFITLIVITSLMVITVVMNLVLPPEETAQELDQEIWKRAAEQSAKTYDDGLTHVYTEDAVSVHNDTLPVASEPEETESPQDPSSVFCVPIQGEILKDYSAEDLQYSETMEDWRVHEGIDFAADEGADVVAALGGTVETVTEDGMMGTSVLLLHPDGTKTFYGNLQEGSAVTEGSQVNTGDVIGKVGRTATLEIIEPPHLHFEVIAQDEPKNPHDYLPGITGE